MSTDSAALNDLWVAVLDQPDDDGPRLAYAARLAERGRRDDVTTAETIRSQLAHPSRRFAVSRADVSIAIASTATARRGFVAEVDITRDDIGRVGELLEEHPVETVWIGDVYLVQSQV